jgi:IS5 family transposase
MLDVANLALRVKAHRDADLRNDIPWADNDVATVQDGGTVLHTENCTKCGGSGSYGRVTQLGHSRCTKCGGKGTLQFKAPAVVREKQRTQAAARKVVKAAETGDANWAAFAAEHPSHATFLATAKFDFAVTMVAKVRQWGSLTDGQRAAVERCILRDAERTQSNAASAVTREALSTEFDGTRLKAAFDAAAASGLKRPGLICGDVDFSRAPDHGRNPGAIYVKVSDRYVGMIVDGRFKAGRDCTAADTAAITAIAADPLGSAIEHGRKTGRCSCCNRELTDPVSVARGIGPICAERFGW